jgi:hypothetical protein
MPCYRCGTRQTDPERGTSPWRRGVRADSLVLICPGCQETANWAADLDQCPECSSVHLVRRLGEVECRECGAVATSGVAPLHASLVAEPLAAGVRMVATDAENALARVDLRPGGDVPTGLDASVRLDVPPSLAEEVEEALARVLGRATRRSGSSSVGA